LSDPRRQTRHIALGTAARVTGKTLGAVLSLLALHLATKYFGPVQWGPITAALAWFTVFSYLGSPGVATLTMREVARPEADAESVFGRALGASLLVSVCSALVAVLIGLAVYWDRSTTLILVLILAPGIPLIAVFFTSGAALVGRDRSGYRAALDLGSSVFLLAATIVVVHAHLRVTGYAVAYLASVVLGGFGALALAASVLRPKLRRASKGTMSMLRDALPLGQVDLFAVVYARADAVMLFVIKGDRPVALYGLAYQAASFLFAVPGMLCNALLPDFMSADTERRQFLARRAMDVILTVALPLPIFGILFARPFVVWLAGIRFSDAGPLLAILTGAAAIQLVNGFLFQIAVMSGAIKGLWRVAGVVTAANLAANGVAVTLWGATGAAYVMIFSEVMGLVLYLRIYRSTMPSPLGRRYPLSAVIAVVALVGVCWALHVGFRLESGSGIAIVPRALALVAVYGVLLRSITLAARFFSASQRQRPPVG
jgi:O-antigen/teichoic acid export membrane protein